ncbi:peptidase M15 [Halarcobacter mediterraneus]|uniref:Peptidase M15 n=1 Tax=Halarcobacter mediterraneus TaxID=2023153 RepID=A0A4Q1AQ28_9BACT|nr:M15 family metallopeptidase [Halarcobacter mediterraneus]RXK11513.1 peptidase M15 [Halarcobacter mediterraneus]
MNRRDFLKSGTSILSLFGTSNLMAAFSKDMGFEDFFYNIFSSNEDLNKENNNFIKDSITIELDEKQISSKSYVKKDLLTDVLIEDNVYDSFLSVRKKLNLVQRHIGYGNFNILSFDEMLKIAKYSNNINAFSKKELEFLESIFYYDPSVHGFYGERISENITDTINKKEVKKIPHTGHYLFKGEPEKIYYQMVKDIGNSLTLTSGVRSIVKQTKLFLDKVYSVEGNLTIASKSLAPPAYTYHSIADFDVGKKGFGKSNFSSRFALTDEFFKMRKLKYIDMRYTVNNKDGVRYEPWHVKII